MALFRKTLWDSSGLGSPGTLGTSKETAKIVRPSLSPNVRAPRISSNSVEPICDQDTGCQVIGCCSEDVKLPFYSNPLPQRFREIGDLALAFVVQISGWQASIHPYIYIFVYILFGFGAFPPKRTVRRVVFCMLLGCKKVVSETDVTWI